MGVPLAFPAIRERFSPLPIGPKGLDSLKLHQRTTKEIEMRKRVLLQSSIVLAGILLLMTLAYWHSMQVSRLFDEAMHRDIQQFSNTLAQSGATKEQAQATVSILNDVNHHTLSYVSSQSDLVIGTIASTAILVMTAVLGLAARTTSGDSSVK